MTAVFKVNKDVLKWVVDQTDTPLNELTKDFKKLDEWLTEDSKISVAQIEKLSKKTKIPFGYFFMNTIPNEDNRIANYRTVENLEINKTSRNLIDVIKEMETKQAWMRDYLIENGAEKLSFIGKFSIDDSPRDIVKDIFEILNFKPGWNTKFRNAYETYSYLRNKLSETGILVMQGSYVGNQNKRKLNLEEFRAFVLIDEYAPLIFINSSDSYTARIFSLVHELVHILLGKEEIYNSNYSLDTKNIEYNNVKLERFCNKVTAEILLPANLVGEKYKINQNLFEMAKKFNVSPHFTAIRLKELNLISGHEFRDTLKRIIIKNKESMENQRIQETSETIIPYYILKQSKIDRRFLNAVKNSVETGYANYTEAYTLTGSKGRTFNNLMGRI